MLSIFSWQIQNLPEIKSSLREKETRALMLSG